MLRILLVVKGFTHPATMGGRQRNALLLRALQQIGEVDLVTVDGSPLGEEDAGYMRAHHGLRAAVAMPKAVDSRPWCWLRGLHPGLMPALAHHLTRQSLLYRARAPLSEVVSRLHAERRYDLVVGRYLLYAMTAGLYQHPRSILDADDVDTEVYRSRLADPATPVWRRWVVRRHLRRLAPVVHRSLSKFSALWVSNPGDRSLPGLERAQVLVNLPFGATVGEGAPARLPLLDCKTAVVVSSWHYKPNAEGLTTFVDKVWPRIRQWCPDARLRVIGSKMSDALREGWREFRALSLLDSSRI